MRNLIAEALANADAEEQAETLNTFVLQLTALCKVSTFGDVGNQQYYIAKHLRGETINFFKEIISSWEYLHKESDKHRVEIDALYKRRDELQKQVDELEKRLSE